MAIRTYDPAPYRALIRRLNAAAEQARWERERSAALLDQSRRIRERVVRERSERWSRRGPDLKSSLVKAKLAAERANEAKSELLRRVAHDLNQPLHIVTMSMDIAFADAPTEKRRVIEHMQTAVRRMRRMVETLLLAARADSAMLEPKIAPFPIGDLLAEIGKDGSAQAAAKGLAWRVVPCRAIVASDRELLASVLENFVGNAMKYTDRGRILVGCRRRAGRLEIQVHDTGRGIPANEFETIFQAFRRLDPNMAAGSGLGLSIVQRLASALGHPLTIRSEAGRGSCFGVVVPIVEEGSGATIST